MRRREDIQRVVDTLARQFKPQRVILFGSQARGDATDDSDVDLLIVLAFSDSPYRMTSAMLRAIRPAFGFDLIPRTPDDVAARYAQGDPMIREAIDQGIVLYEAAA